MFGWLWKLLGLQRRGREWTEFDRQYAEMLELRKKKMKLDMLEASAGGSGKSRGVSRLADDIEDIKDIASQMGWIGEEQKEDDSMEKQVSKILMQKMLGTGTPQSETTDPTNEDLVNQEGTAELQRVLQAVQSGALSKTDFKKLAGQFYDQNKPLNSKKKK
tara:strand:+ start:665 stop:1147 length:483 start_codon:yes stop_codon:yes gene_type:complete